MSRHHRGILLGLLLAVASPPGLSVAEDEPLGLEDLPSYHAALRTDPVTAQPLRVRFRDLWDRPDAYRNRWVVLEGQQVRQFHQAAVGRFPALTETWVVDQAGNPTCFVFPSAVGDALDPGMGSWVRLTGTFMKRVTYQGGKGRRLAPLVVGTRGPVLVSAPASAVSTARTYRPVDWAIGLGLGASVAVVMLGLHFRRPRPRVSALGPAPMFVSGSDDLTTRSSQNGNIHQLERSEHEAAP